MEIEVVLLEFALGIFSGVVRVLLDVESARGENRMPANNTRDDGDDLRSLPN
jgi:hypothetical protein